MSKKKTDAAKAEEAAGRCGDEAGSPSATQEALLAELSAAVAEKEEAERRMLRLQADMDNFRRRTAREKEEWWRAATGDVLKQFLPVLDNFSRAMETAPAESDDWTRGMIMIYNQLQSSLEAMGLESVCNEGYFDPNCHEALIPDNDPGKPANMITAVFEKGYKYKGRLLRPSKVRVSTGGSN